MEDKENNKSISDLLKMTVIKFCCEHYASNSDLEIDAIICLSATDKQNQNVVKIHQILPKNDHLQVYTDALSEVIKRNPAGDNGSSSNRISESKENTDSNILLSSQPNGAESTDDKWIRMNRLRVYKKKRKIAVQRRKIYQESKTLPDSPVKTHNTGYMLRVPSVTHQTKFSTLSKKNVENAEQMLESSVTHEGNNSLQQDFDNNYIKIEPMDPDEVQSYTYEDFNLGNASESETMGSEIATNQVVFPPRSYDSYYSGLEAFNNCKDSEHMSLEESTNSNVSNNCHNTGVENVSREPRILNRRKRKQNCQNILRMSEKKVDCVEDDGRKISSLLSSEMLNSSTGNDTHETKPKIIIQNASDSLLEKQQKQPRLVSLLTQGFPKLKKMSSSKSVDSVSNVRNDDPDCCSSNVVGDMADIASMQKTVSSGRVMSLLKQKSKSMESSFSADQVFYCSKCGSGFKSKKSKMRHEKYTCGELRSFECEVCGKFYSRADSKTRHMFRIHGIKPGLSQGSFMDPLHNIDCQNGSLDLEENQNLVDESHSNQGENLSEPSTDFKIEIYNDSE